MVKSNTKPIPKSRKLTPKKKKELLNKLENTVKNVSKRGLYFVVGNKQSFFKVIDSKDKRITYTDISIREACDVIQEILNSATTKDIPLLINKLNEVVRKHQPQVDKFIMDLRFYNHTIDTTDDMDKLIITEARQQDAYGRYQHAKENYISALYICKVHHSQASRTNPSSF
tara:strand:+ start:2209 stop:2721 length:513 start_codon:yes stop_codon:yes gene_type:complete